MRLILLLIVGANEREGQDSHQRAIRQEIYVFYFAVLYENSSRDTSLTFLLGIWCVLREISALALTHYPVTRLTVE